MERSDEMPRTQVSPETIDPSTKDGSNWQSALNRWMPLAVTVCMVAGVARSVVEPLISHLPWMTYEEDDFFYYLKIAQNLAHGSGSTFNGIVATNGYHPLWMLLLTLFSFFTTKPKLVFLFLSACTFVSTLATYFLSRALIRLSGAGNLIASALSVYVTLYSMHLFDGGMEVILTIPLVLAVLLVAQRTAFWQRGVWQSACLGLLVALMALSRLDTILLATLIFLSLLLHPKVRSSLRSANVQGLALGLTPLILYFLSNRIWFHTWLPVSGMAKQLKFNHLPASPAFKSLYDKQPIQWLNILPVVLAILLLPAIYKRLTAMQQVLYPVVLLFPFIYLSVLSCLSDWRLWDWYFYPFRIGMCVAFALFCLWKPTAWILQKPAVGALVALMMIPLLYREHHGTGAQYQLLEVAEGVRDFAASHPGVYGMGDRSGMVGYLLPQPMVQTEGLVMDRRFLENIQQQRPLRDAVKQYGVRYYIGTTYPPFTAGCFHAVEPWQAGPGSPHMQADFCEQPAAVFQQSDVRTMIYDLNVAPSTVEPHSNTSLQPR
jgi:hypothetical protein